MLCQICQKNPMTMKITKLVGGVPTEYNVCAECAPKVSAHHAKIMKSKKVDEQTVKNLLKDLLESQGVIGAKIEDVGAMEDVPVCPDCGLDYLRFRQTYMLGCPNCYDAFGETLKNDIRRIHGATSHVDKAPASVLNPEEADRQTRLRSLQRELHESVETEDFGRAAQLRDEIHKLQEELAGKGEEK